jgi:putative protein kinase ArgK-like GTPase of G3E family
LVSAVAQHAAWSQSSGEWTRRRERRLRDQVRALLVRDVAGFAFARDGSPKPAFASLMADVSAGKVSPQEASRRILEQFRRVADA